MKQKSITGIFLPDGIDGLIPGVRGQRAFPTAAFSSADPFLMLDHIGPQSVGKSWQLDGLGHDHPHRGFETITFMFEGTMQHRDSLGNGGFLTSGSAQRMNAGSGIIHGGDMGADPKTGRFHEVQLWVNNPKAEKMSEPDIHNIQAEEVPTLAHGNHQLRVFSGMLNGLVGPLITKAETTIAHLKTSDVGVIDLTGFSQDQHLMVYVLEGELKVDGKHLAFSELAEFGIEGDTLRIETSAPAQALILAGKPLNEPIAYGGPFVMNTQEEIRQAGIDFQNGLFGKIS